MSKKHRKKYSSVKSHKRDRSKLKPPLSQLNMEMIDWERDFLPEHLWIDLLAQEYKDYQWNKMYDDFLDKLEKEIEDKSLILYGFITDFGLVPEDSKVNFINNNKDLIYNVFFKPIGKILTLYPDNPANWLLLEEWINSDKIDFEVELKKLNRSVIRLMKAKDLYAGHIRAIPLGRLFVHQKLFYPKDMPVTELLPKYPGGCTEDEQYKVQSHARMTMNMEYMRDERYESRYWPKHFWRQNYNLVPCSPSNMNLSEENKISETDYLQIQKIIENNCDLIISYLDKVSIQYKYDLYETLKDEILLGLFSRIVRLFVSYVNDPNLWARDLSGIMLRCIVDTAITFAYLVEKGSLDDFMNFKKYGEGKEKLLMLHLQDSYTDKKAVNNKGVDELEIDLGGGFNPELIEIELAGWTKKSSRDFAKLCGFEDLYKLVYDPASSDIHGTWTSLKSSNLVYCTMSLHRYHKMPSFIVPPLFIQNIKIVHELYERCYNLGVQKLDFPKMDDSIKDIKIEHH